jgi:hypothetical protein
MIKGVIFPLVDDLFIQAMLINKKGDTNDVELEDQPFDLLLFLPTFSNCSIDVEISLDSKILGMVIDHIESCRVV